MIKNIFIFGSTLFFCANAINAQPLTPAIGRYITVTGSAEVVVQPDEIELEIVLKEFEEVDGKVDLKMADQRFQAILKKHKVPQNKLQLSGAEFYWYYWWTYRNEPYKHKRYSVKLDKSTDFLSLVQDLDVKWVEAVRIANTTNKELQQQRRQVKIDAMKAAKEKAQYLLESIGENAGKIISVEEVNDNNGTYFWQGGSNILSNTISQAKHAESELDNVASIRLRCEIRAIFEIK